MGLTFSLFSRILENACKKGIINENDIIVEEGASLSKLTSFKTGGSSEAAVYPKTAEALISLVGLLKENEIKFFVLGNGSNVLAPDQGYDGIVLSTTLLKNYKIQNNMIIAEAGCNLIDIAKVACDNSLSGLEFAYGIPGTLGGAVFMNAGAYDSEMKNVVFETKALLNGNIKTFFNEEHEFGYRNSCFNKNGAIILETSLLLSKAQKEDIWAKMDGFMQRRIEKQPLEYPSAGSVFKRYPGRYTGQMIEECGLKGKRVGGAMVSEKHAGFIINYDSAKSDDILKLIDIVKNEIFKKEGIEIECEVRILK